MSNAVCTHLGEVAVRELPSAVEGCEDCLRDGGKWLHLRICLTCGHVAAATTRRTGTRPRTITPARTQIIRSL
jgi:hypothetical protein